MLLSRFLKDRDGSVVLMLGVAAIPLFASMGAAVDYTRGNSVRAAMQGAADASVLALAKEPIVTDATKLNTTGKGYFISNFARPELNNLQTNVTASSTSNRYTVSMVATGHINTSIMSVVGIRTVNISTRASAIRYNEGLGCVLALNPHLSGSVTEPGTATVNLNGCSLYANSDHNTALTVSGSANLNAQSVGVVGDLTGESNISTTDGVRRKVAPIADPYADVSQPVASACTETNFSAHSSNNITINPGVYCGGMTINAGATVKLTPGIYYLDGGSLTVNGGATMTGDGVTLVFTSKNRHDYASASISGGATIDLTPPKVGPTTGIVMFGDRNMPVGTDFVFNGGSTQNLAGAVYLSRAAVKFAGGLGTKTTCTQLIADTITFAGNSGLAVDCSQYKTKDFYQTVVRLIQ